MEHYKHITGLCKTAINNYYASKEDKLIESGNLGAFYRFVNSKTSFKSGVASLRDSAGVVHYENHAKAKLLSDFFFNSVHSR